MLPILSPARPYARRSRLEVLRLRIWPCSHSSAAFASRSPQCADTAYSGQSHDGAHRPSSPETFSSARGYVCAAGSHVGTTEHTAAPSSAGKAQAGPGSCAAHPQKQPRSPTPKLR